MAQNLEDFYPPIQSAGLNTQKAVALGSTLAVTGNSTMTGTLSVTGATTFTGATSFGGIVLGELTNIVSASTVTTLTTAQSGSMVVFNSTSGVAVRLPSTPTAGTMYQFVVGQAPSAGTHGITTASAGIFLVGTIAIGAGTAPVLFKADGIVNVATSFNGTTTGGSAGTYFTATAISGTQWAITGQGNGSGLLATPIV